MNKQKEKHSSKTHSVHHQVGKSALRLIDPPDNWEALYIEHIGDVYKQLSIDCSGRKHTAALRSVSSPLNSSKKDCNKAKKTLRPLFVKTQRMKRTKLAQRSDTVFFLSLF